MSIFNTIAQGSGGGGGGEIKSEDFSLGASSQYLSTITTSTIPSWWLLVGGAHGSVSYCITAAFNDGTGIYNRSTSSASTVTGYETTITASIISGALRLEAGSSTSDGRFYGNYTLYYL